ncbi:peptidoglycan-binding domain-containing protein [Leifsonia poae]|uniref:peptidoglycan-binding domain-containing protein n=1 Tax=Leifsonia poae TaxID=110933 RepID=UPI003D6899FE
MDAVAGQDAGTRAARSGALAVVALAVAVLTACSGGTTELERAQAEVTAKQKAVTSAEAEASSTAAAFCEAGKAYITGLDRYGDILTSTAPTVGDVRSAGAELSRPRDAAFDGADAAVAAHEQLVTAQKELADAEAKLRAVQTGTAAPPSPSPSASVTPLPSADVVNRVKTADTEFTAAQESIGDETPLAEAAVQFNSAAVALEFAWLRLFADAGCIPDERAQDAQAAVGAYVAALQNDLAAAGYYTGAVDGIYGPQTAAAVEALQQKNGLPVTGAVDKATAAALQKELAAAGGAAAKDDTAATIALQQTLKLAGYWDGPVDGAWTPALTEAVMALQTDLGVPATGVVDAVTISAFEKALAQAKQPATTSTPTPSATAG